MDVSVFLQDEMIVWVPVGEARVKVRYLSTGDRAKIRAALTTLTASGATMDVGLVDVETCATTVVDWEGFEADGVPVPCTPDNVRKLARWPDFAEAVVKSSFNVEQFRASALEETKKNSLNTSTIEQITPESVAAIA